MRRTHSIRPLNFSSCSTRVTSSTNAKLQDKFSWVTGVFPRFHRLHVFSPFTRAHVFPHLTPIACQFSRARHQLTPVVYICVELWLFVCVYWVYFDWPHAMWIAVDWAFTAVTKKHKTTLLGSTQTFPSCNILYFLGRVWRLWTMNWEMFGRLVEARIMFL